MTEVPRLTKKEWPARITNALGIPSIRGSKGPWHSVGDTIDVAWFHALCDLLGINYLGECTRAVEKIIEATGATWDGKARAPGVPAKRPVATCARKRLSACGHCSARMAN